MIDNLKIHWKILGLAGVLSALTIFVAGMSVNSMQTYEMRVDRVAQVSDIQQATRASVQAIATIDETMGQLRETMTTIAAAV